MKIRKIYKKLPGNRVKIREERANPRIAICGVCGVKLHGIKKLSSNKIKNMPKSKNGPNRMNGGNLCSKCSRERILMVTRG
mgnify:CR=1 FL=1